MMTVMAKPPGDHQGNGGARNQYIHELNFLYLCGGWRTVVDALDNRLI
jgi:hypothetical protein